MNKVLTIKNLAKTFHTTEGEVEAIKDISADVYENEIIGIVGASGCGKSTLLNILAELEEKTSGEIERTGNFSYMLQSDALLPWLNLLDNACLGLEINNIKTEENINYAKGLLHNFGLDNFLKAYPKSLSGGMKQRVALVRTLATKPSIILLDEPLSALDYVTRLNICDDIHRLVKSTNVTTILITHDIAECISMCDRVIILSKRPAEINKIIEIDFDKNRIPSENRKDPLFRHYYDLVWSEIK